MFLFVANTSDLNYQNIIDKMLTIEKTDILQIDNFEELKQTILIPYFLPAVYKDPTIQCLLGELHEYYILILDSFSITAETSVSQIPKKFEDIAINGKIEIKNVIANIIKFNQAYKDKLLEIWAKVDELLNRFINLYFQTILLMFKKKIKQLSIEIREKIVKKMKLLYEFGKIDNISLIVEQNEVLFLKTQVSQLLREIASNKQQAAILGFDISHRQFFQINNFIFCDFSDEKNQTEQAENLKKIEDFSSALYFHNVDHHGLIVISPRDLSECAPHVKHNPTPIDLHGETSAPNFKFYPWSNNSYKITIEASASKLLQIVLNEATSKLNKILNELFDKGLEQYKSTEALLQTLKQNLAIINKTNKAYISGFEKEIKKFSIDASNLLSLLKFIDHNMLNMLINKQEANVQICIKHFEIMSHTISMLIAKDLIQNKLILINDIEDSTSETDHKNPFKDLPN